MTTELCATTIAEGKHGHFAEQNHVHTRFLLSVLVRSSL